MKRTEAEKPATFVRKTGGRLPKQGVPGIAGATVLALKLWPGTVPLMNFVIFTSSIKMKCDANSCFSGGKCPQNRYFKEQLSLTALVVPPSEGNDISSFPHFSYNV